MTVKQNNSYAEFVRPQRKPHACRLSNEFFHVFYLIFYLYQLQKDVEIKTWLFICQQKIDKNPRTIKRDNSWHTFFLYIYMNI